jgi:RHS repeat-associated protein
MFAYDGSNVWAELDASNTVQKRHLYLNGANQEFATITTLSGAVTWEYSDRLGSVRLLTNSNGTVLNHLDYDAYGNLVSQTAGAALDLLGYAGYVWDRTLGLDYAQARYYDPASARSLSQDPLGLAPDSNPYRYVSNGPTNATDPNGQYLIPSKPWRMIQPFAT